MSEESQSFEAENPVLGKLKVSSANLNTLFTVLGFILTALIAWVLFNHTNDTKDASKELAGAMKEMTQVTRESNCLNAMPPERREIQAEFCKRLSR